VKIVDETAPQVLRLALRAEEAAAAFGISRASVYELVRSGVWPSFHVGRLLRIPVAGLEAFIEERLEEEEASS
jgi:excisionase family DNA binding protein